MRKRYRVLLFAAMVAAIIGPLGFALSLESEPKPSTPMTPPGIVVSTTSTPVASSVLISSGEPPQPAILHSVPDAAKLLFVGTVLFGLAAAVRKTAA